MVLHELVRSFAKPVQANEGAALVQLPSQQHVAIDFTPQTGETARIAGPVFFMVHDGRMWLRAAELCATGDTLDLTDGFGIRCGPFQLVPGSLRGAIYAPSGWADLTNGRVTATAYCFG